MCIKCNLCDYRAGTFPHLRTHLSTLHMECTIGYECFFCMTLPKSPYSHRQHLIRRHRDNCDLTTPPLLGRIDPRKSAHKPQNHIPPLEARTMPTPPKRFKPDPGKPKPTSMISCPQVFDIDEFLRADLQISDEDFNLRI